MAECRARADAATGKGRPRNWVVGALIIAVWLAAVAWVVLMMVKYFAE
jgi:hypothetical protein